MRIGSSLDLAEQAIKLYLLRYSHEGSAGRLDFIENLAIARDGRFKGSGYLQDGRRFWFYLALNNGFTGLTWGVCTAPLSKSCFMEETT